MNEILIVMIPLSIFGAMLFAYEWYKWDNKHNQAKTKAITYTIVRSNKITNESVVNDVVLFDMMDD